MNCQHPPNERKSVYRYVKDVARCEERQEDNLFGVRHLACS